MALRAAGNVLPSAGGIDFRVMGKLHRMVPRSMRAPWTAGNGFKMGAATNNAAYISGVNERRWLDCVAGYLPPAGLVLNIGANTGYTALYLAKAAARRHLACKFMAMEPEPGTFQLLRENIQLNALPIEGVEAAAGDVEGTATIFSVGAGDGAASLDGRGGGDRKGIEIRVRRVDDVVAKAGAVTGLVVDVEGFGGGALRGAALTLKRYKPFVASEMHSEQELQEMEAVLLPLGYKQRRVLKGIWGEHRMWTFA